MKMDKSVQKTLIVMAGIVAVLLIGILTYSNFSSANTVTGNGQATIKAVPDLIGVYFSVDTTGTTSADATSKNSDIVDKLVLNLMKQGIDRDRIQTTGFNVYPDYDYSNQNPVLKGYKATHSITVQLSTSDSGKIGDVIDAGVSAGAGISYINFELSQSKQNEYKAQALKAATEDAKIKATAITQGLGKTLGRLVSITDNSFNYYPWPLYQSRDMGVGGGVSGAEAKAATTSIVPGEQEVSASVTAVYKIR
ncbi:MAG: SIMPL domain-containing protein [Nanoarchaeota archaeon]|nr:SIMPL domain-containing protein [Nanoarchaeota archaeon]